MPRITKAQISEMARLLGARGGRKRSPAKTAAARINATYPRPNRRKKTPAKEAA